MFKNKLYTMVLCLCALILPAHAAHAHSLWVNLFESHLHAPGHVLTSIGWGHFAPIDDLLSTPSASANIARYYITAPDGTEVVLPLPESTVKTTSETPYADIITGDIGIRKIALKKDSPQGTYQVAASSKVSFFSRYKDKNGKMRMAAKPMDQLKDVGEVLESFRYSLNAKAFYSIGKWTKPKPAGFDLEITPESNLSNMRKGDMVSFDVSFMGKPVNTDSNAINYMTLTSDTFGGPDGYFLSAYIMNGKAKFRIPTAGHWVANVYVTQQTSPKGPLSNLAKKCSKVFSCATVSFTAKP
ncbi:MULTISPECIES: DUF4198 domain-containing protein [unclassified Maridesulfovibrio]|uniref:DUF4198 domain-containing protein n=1 Tax=unclassified Maridesulfovibrio TaxID=2794999 RepID=UPI003B3F746F